MLALCQVLLALAVCLFLAQYLKLQWSRGRFPPGPTPLPIIGNLWTLRSELHYETLMQLAKTYGNIFTVWLGQTPVIVLNGCQAVRKRLISHSEELSGRPTTPVFEAVSGGKGVIFTSGHTWKQQRRFGLMTLRNLGLGKKSLEGRIQDEARFLVEMFAMGKGTPMDPSPAIVNSATNVISAVVFGHRFSSEDEVYHQLIEANDFIANFLGIMWARLYNTFPWLMQRLPGPLHTFYKCNAFLNSSVEQEVKSHRENGIPEEPQDLIDFCLTEVSKGTIVLANISSSLYDPEHWETPRQFNPGHFLDKEGNFVISEAFLPFSAGHRACLGELMARIEIFLFFTNLLRAFTFRLPEGVKEVNMDYIFGITLQPHPYKICAIPR